MSISATYGRLMVVAMKAQASRGSISLCLAIIAASVSICVGMFPATSHAAWFGKNDPRYQSSAYISSPEIQQRYSGVGRIACPSKEFLIRDGIKTSASGYSTAFHLGSFKIMITNAHAFYEVNTRGSIVWNSIDPKHCRAVFYDYSGNILEEIGIDRVFSRWDDKKYLGDWTEDIAIVVLAKESTIPTYHLPFHISDRPIGASGNKVTVVGYSSDLNDSRVKRIGSGTIYPARANPVRDAKEGRNRDGVVSSFTFVGNYPTGHGSSGSPIVSEAGKVIGIHQGSFRTSGENSRKFNIDNNHNNGILFDNRFWNDLSVVFDKNK